MNTPVDDSARAAGPQQERACDHDIFISYAHADDADGFVTGFIEWLRGELYSYASDFDVCFIDRKDIHTMDDWQNSIEAGLRSSRLLVALVSPAYFLSPFCRREWETYQRLGSEEALLAYTRTAAALQIEHCQPLNDREQLTAQQLIERFRALGEQRGTPAHRLPSGEEKEAFADWVGGIGRIQSASLADWRETGPVALKEEKVRERLQNLSQTLQQAAARRRRRRASFSNVPQHNPKFVGRVRELRELRDTLAVREREGTVAVLNSAMPGIGKSALAFEYAHVFAPEYLGGRFYIRAEGLTELAAALEQLDTPLGLRLEPAQRADPEKLINAISHALQQRQGTALLLFDNLDDPSVLDEVGRLTGADQVHVLATTRLPAERFPDQCRCIPLGPVTAEDSARLLEAHRSPADEGERAAAREIARRLDGYPFALELVAVTLAGPRRRQSYADYLDDMAQQGLDLSLREGGTSLKKRDIRLSHRPREETRILQALLDPVLDTLTAAQYETLCLAAHLPPDRVPLRWLQHLIAADFPETAELKPHQEGSWASAILDVLAGLRLLVPDAGDAAQDARQQPDPPRMARLHRVLGELITVREAAEPTSRRRARIVAHIHRRAADLDITDIPARWEIAPLQETAARLARDSQGDEAGHLAGILINTGNSHYQTAEYRLALDAHEQTEEIERQLVEGEGRSERRADLAGSLNNKGVLLDNLQRHAKALEAYKEAEGIRRQLVEAEGRSELRADLAGSLNNKGVVLNHLQRHAEALDADKEAEQIERQLVASEGRSEHRADLAASLTNKGNALAALQRHAKALEAYNEAEGVQRQLVEGEGRSELRADLARSLSNKGAFLNDLLRHAEALEAHKEAEKIRRQLVEGEGRCERGADLAQSLFNKGSTLIHLKRHAEALDAWAEGGKITHRLANSQGRDDLQGFLESRLNTVALGLFYLGQTETLRRLVSARPDLFSDKTKSNTDALQRGPVSRFTAGSLAALLFAAGLVLLSRWLLIIALPIGAVSLLPLYGAAVRSVRRWRYRKYAFDRVEALIWELESGRDPGASPEARESGRQSE